MHPAGLVRKTVALACVIVLFVPAQAFARGGWACDYGGGGGEGAHYLARYERRGDTFVEQRWPAPIAYHILIDRDDILIAAHASAPRDRRGGARGSVIVLMIDKWSGHARRSTASMGTEADEISFGTCERF